MTQYHPTLVPSLISMLQLSIRILNLINHQLLYLFQTKQLIATIFFEFRFNHFSSIHINLQRGISLIYSAYLLVHRQISSDIILSELNPVLNVSGNMDTNKKSHGRKNLTSSCSKKSNFVNISSYFNERLFNITSENHIFV